MWATLNAKTLDESQPINISLGCIAGGDDDSVDVPEVQGEIIPTKLANEFEIESFDEIDIGCRIDNLNVRTLGVGNQIVRFRASFDKFKTQAYLKTYFMDKDRKREMQRNGIDILAKYGIMDSAPVAQYTAGPVKIGAETTKSLPIGISSGEPILPRFGITIENLWEGKIEKINEIIVKTPSGITLEHCPSGKPKEENDDGLILNRYDFDLSNPGIGKTEDIDTFITMNCVMDVAPDKILGSTPVSTRYLRIETNYKYQLETRFNVEIRESKTSDEENYAETLKLESENFDINIQNMKNLEEYTDSLIGINQNCMRGDVNSATKLIDSSKSYDKETKDKLKHNVNICKNDNSIISLDIAEALSWSSENILSESERAKINIRGFKEDVYITKRDSLNSEILNGKSAMEKTLEHINEIKQRFSITPKDEQKIKDALEKLTLLED